MSSSVSGVERESLTESEVSSGRPVIQDIENDHRRDDHRKDTPGAAKARKMYITVEPVSLLFVCFLVISQPLTSQYIFSEVADAQNFTGHRPGEEGNCTPPASVNTSSPEAAVQQESTQWMIKLNLATSLPAILSTLLLTGYCDRVGRKLPMLLPIVGTVLRSAIFLVVVRLRLHISFLIIGCLVDGLCGGASCFYMAVFSWLADITTVQQRTFRILVVELCISLGGSLAALLGGLIIDKLGFMWPFVILVAVCSLNFLYTYFLIPETIQKVPGTKAVSLSHMKDAAKVYFSAEPGTKRRPKLLLCLAIIMVTNIVIIGKSDCEVYHLLAAPLCWSSFMIGIFQAVTLMVGTISSLATTVALQKRVGDCVLLLWGCISGAAYETMFALATTTYFVFLTPLAGQWFVLVTPMIRSISSKLVKPTEQGAMFAGIGLVQLVSVMLGFTAFDAVYQATVLVYPSTVFFVMTGCFVLGALLSAALLILRKMKRDGFNYGPILTVTS